MQMKLDLVYEIAKLMGREINNEKADLLASRFDLNELTRIYFSILK